MYQSASSFGILFIVVAALIIWVGPAIMTGWLAGERGREPLGWGLLALLFGPLALVAVGLSPVVTPFRCPMCREPFREGAQVCPHCRSALPLTSEIMARVAAAEAASAASPDARPAGGTATAAGAPGVAATPGDAWSPSLDGPLVLATGDAEAASPAAGAFPAPVLAAGWSAVSGGSVPPGWWTVRGSVLEGVRRGERVLFRADSDGLSLLGMDARRVGLLPRGAFILALSDDLPGSLLVSSQARMPVVLLERWDPQDH